MKRRHLTAILLPILACAGILTACGSSQGQTVSSQPAASSAAAVSSAVQSAAPVYQEEKRNNLTGEYTLTKAAEGKRPIAVMINNIETSLPQYGIGAADLMFETLVEGGITRMMAVYGDYTQIPTVCSVRSCRYYFPILAQGLDAIYCHSGVDVYVASGTLEELGIDHFDTTEGLFERDQERLQTYATEHTMCFLGQNVPQFLAETGTRVDLLAGKNTPIFNFNKPDVVTTPGNGQNPCTYINLNYSASYWSTFTYDAANHVYLKQHNGELQMDSATKEQLAYTNVFVLQSDIGHFSEYSWLVEMDLSSGGTGYYISNGGYQEILWSKPTANDSIQITDQNGNPVAINTGKSYIGIINYGNTELA